MSSRYLPTEFAPLLLILGGCHPDSTRHSQSIEGTVQVLGIEGGCWVIETAEGRVQPLGLPTAFQREGLAVRATVTDPENVLTSCQVGVPKQIQTIEVRK
jgi:hypothetical protein